MDTPNANPTAGLDRLLVRLQNVKRAGQQRWTACCPAHEDARPSLSVRLAPDGVVLLHCFAGCSADEVVTAVNMELGELFPEPSPGVHRRAKLVKPWNLNDVVRSLALDALTIVQLSNIMLRGEALEPSAHAALVLAAARFLAAEGLLNA